MRSMTFSGRRAVAALAVVAAAAGLAACTPDPGGVPPPAHLYCAARRAGARPSDAGAMNLIFFALGLAALVAGVLGLAEKRTRSLAMR